MNRQADEFEQQLREDRRTERGLAWRELAALALVALLLILQLRFGG